MNEPKVISHSEVVGLKETLWVEGPSGLVDRADSSDAGIFQ